MGVFYWPNPTSHKRVRELGWCSPQRSASWGTEQEKDGWRVGLEGQMLNIQHRDYPDRGQTKKISFTQNRQPQRGQSSLESQSHPTATNIINQQQVYPKLWCISFICINFHHDFASKRNYPPKSRVTTEPRCLGAFQLWSRSRAQESQEVISMPEIWTQAGSVGEPPQQMCRLASLHPKSSKSISYSLWPLRFQLGVQ